MAGSARQHSVLLAAQVTLGSAHARATDKVFNTGRDETDKQEIYHRSMTYYFVCVPVLKLQFCTITDYYTHVGEAEGAYSQVYLLLVPVSAHFPQQKWESFYYKRSVTICEN